MAIKYVPAVHSAPHQATLDSVAVYGVGPGELVHQLTDPRAAAVVWVASGLNADGTPGKMIPVPTTTDHTVT